MGHSRKPIKCEDYSEEDNGVGTGESLTRQGEVTATTILMIIRSTVPSRSSNPLLVRRMSSMHRFHHSFNSAVVDTQRSRGVRKYRNS